MTRGRTWMRWAAAAFALAVPVAGCSKAAPAAPTLAPVAPIADCVTDDDQRAHGVTLLRSDGDDVNALVYGTGKTGVVFANQVDGDLCQWQSYAQIVAQKGYTGLVFNYSGSAGPDKDVLAAVATLRQRGVTNVFLVGASKGGTMVLAAAAEVTPPVSGVVSLSGPLNYDGVSAEDTMAHFSTPVIFIAGDSDAEFTDAAKAMYAACAEKDKKLILQSGGNHGVALVDAKMLNTTILGFFTTHTAS